MSEPKSRLISAVSMLFWVWGILVLLSGFAIGYPAVATRGAFGPLVVTAVWGIAYCLGGFALRRRQWGVRWWGSALCIISTLVLLVIQVRVSSLGVAVNVAALVLIAMSWRALLLGSGPSPPVQPTAGSGG